MSTACTNSESKETWWEWSKLNYTKCTTYCKYMLFGGYFVALEACLHWNDTSIMICSLSKLASDISKKLILDRIEDLSCAWSSIMGQENPASEDCIWAGKSWAMSQHPTLWDAGPRCAITSMIWQQELRLCHENVSPCLIVWHKYSISPSLFWLPNGIGEYAVLDLSQQYAQDSPVHWNFNHRPASAAAMPQISWHRYSISPSPF